MDSNHLHKCSVDVRPTGCLGYCSQGPAVSVLVTTPVPEHEFNTTNRRRRRKRSSRRIHVEIDTFEKSADVLKQSVGAAASIDLNFDNLPDEARTRLSKLKRKRAREYLISTYQWNKALKGMEEDAMDDENLQRELQWLLTKAGYPEPPIQLDPEPPIDQDEWLIHSSLPARSNSMPTSIENYVPWTLNSVKVVSSHSAIFKLTTRDPKRGTPHPRGRGRVASPITWHVTMLGEVGIMKDEGPLPWIERDYTPISSALDWERGKVEILIKIYNLGRLTSWLRRRTSAITVAQSEEGKDSDSDEENMNRIKIWLSKPVRTLSMPYLVPGEYDFTPSSVLLLLAGTGIVALPQILAHRNPYRSLGIATPKSSQLQCPIDLILSCREDDLLMLQEINNWCVEGKRPHPRFQGLRNCTLLITKKKDDEQNTPYPEFQPIQQDRVSILQELRKNMVNIHYSQRLNKDMIADSLGRMVQHCRVVLSGPDSYNQSVKKLLEECGLDTSTYLTVLSA
uniref:FAD-binding FR-type domain-containing protein n=1 Tax=Corethron hystrix TaxID=216773 RepID=A0A7S1BNI5_9STRA